MKKYFSIIAIIGLLSCQSFVSVAKADELPNLMEQSSINKQNHTDRVIVKFKNQQTTNSTQKYKVTKKNVGKDKRTLVVKVPNNMSTSSFIKQMKQKDDVALVEPDVPMHAQAILTQSANDPFVSSQWFHANIHTKEAWKKTLGSSKVIVAVIDDGVDLKHRELSSHIVNPYDVITGTQTNPKGEHGTHVAGIIAASVENSVGGAGVAPNTSIMPINVFSGDVAYTSDIIDGIHYAVDHGAKIINMSLGGDTYSQSFNDAIQYAYNHGVLVVAAAGNESSSAPSYPAAYNHVISVSSTTSRDTVSSFSNYGTSIDLAAPGSYILSTIPNNNYLYMSGTSMASPVVTGVAALVWAYRPYLTADQIAQDLFQTADDLGARGKDPYYGYGRVNAQKALMIEVPTVHAVSDQTTTMTGTTSPLIRTGTVMVLNKNAIIGTAAIQPNHTFSVRIPKQIGGSTLQVVVKDEVGNVSAAKLIVVSKTPVPAKPTVNLITTRTKVVSGKAQLDTKIVVKIGNRSYSSYTKNGLYSISIPSQRKGTLVVVYASNKFGIKSQDVRLYVK